MAAQTCIFSKHATLTGTTADTVTFSGDGGGQIAVSNRDSANSLWFTIHKSAGTIVTAVASADQTFAVLPLQTKILNAPTEQVISIVGNGNAYSAEMW